MLLATSLSVWAKPVILFSDVISAPKSGWSAGESDKGAVVTIWGRNFGASRGNSFVTVGGVNLTADTDYKDGWAKTSNPVPYLETITFQLNDSMQAGNGDITVTVDGVRSNALPFRINTIGKIYFVHQGSDGNGTFESPWDDQQVEAGFLDPNKGGVASPGDVLYFRGGTYSEMMNTGKSHFWVEDDFTPGTESDPISVVGYPGEDPYWDGMTNGDASSFNKGINVNAEYWTFAKLRIKSLFSAASMSAWHTRIVGSDLIGDVYASNGQGIVNANDDDTKILGNAIHGARSNWKLDHAVYIGGCQSTEGSEIAYNYVYDNFFDRGPLMSENHQASRCSSSEYQKATRWHHNVIDCSFRGPALIGYDHDGSSNSKPEPIHPTVTATPEDSEVRAIHIHSLSWDPGAGETEPEPTLVYNNVLYQCGRGEDTGALVHNNGHAIFANNTMWDNRGTCMSVPPTTSNPILSLVFVNNVCHQNQAHGWDYYHERVDDGGPRTFKNNAYFNGDVSGLPPYESASSMITSDPQILVDISSRNPVVVKENSPLINAGVSDYANIFNHDLYGASHIGGIDVGAVEFIDGLVEQLAAPMPPSNLLIQVLDQ